MLEQGPAAAASVSARGGSPKNLGKWCKAFMVTTAGFVNGSTGNCNSG